MVKFHCKSEQQKKAIRRSYAIRSNKPVNDNNSSRYAEFLRAGGKLSGVYDVSDRATLEFVKKYRDFIPESEIYRRDKNGSLVPVYKRGS